MQAHTSAQHLESYNMKTIYFFAAIVLLGLASLELMAAYDPSPLQDICVALNNSKVFVNGKFCKDPKLVTANDFFYPGLNIPANTTNAAGSGVTLVTVDQIPGLNTMGISMVRVDYAPGGVVPLHTHQRATEVLTVIKGTLYVGFVTSFPEYRLISKTLHVGDVFVFPFGLIHFQFNIGKEPAAVLGALSSQNPGFLAVGNAVFGSNPPIPTNVLERAFQVDEKVIALLQEPYQNN